jgi:hypothetical protein
MGNLAKSLLIKANSQLVKPTPLVGTNVIGEPLEVSGERFIAPPADYEFDSPEHPWEVKAPADTQFYNLQSGLSGTFAVSKTAGPSKVIPTNRAGLTAEEKKSLKPNLGMYTELEHSNPLAFGGVNRYTNLTNMVKSDHTKKTEAEAVAWTLFTASEESKSPDATEEQKAIGRMIEQSLGRKIGLREAQAKAIYAAENPNSLDVSGITGLTIGNGDNQRGIAYNIPGKTKADQIRLAIETWKKWESPLEPEKASVWDKIKEVGSAFRTIFPGTDLIGERSKEQKEVANDVAERIAKWAPDNFIGAFIKAIPAGISLGSVGAAQEKWDDEHPLQALVAGAGGQFLGALPWYALFGSLLGLGVSKLQIAANPKISAALGLLRGGTEFGTPLSLKSAPEALKLISRFNKLNRLATTVGTFTVVGQLSAQDPRFTEGEARRQRLMLDAALGGVAMAVPSGFLRAGFNDWTKGTGRIGSAMKASAGPIGNLGARFSAGMAAMTGNYIAETILTDSTPLEAMENALTMTIMHGSGAIHRKDGTVQDVAVRMRAKAREYAPEATGRHFDETGNLVSTLPAKSAEADRIKDLATFRSDYESEIERSFDLLPQNASNASERTKSRMIERIIEADSIFGADPSGSKKKQEWLGSEFDRIYAEERARSGEAAITGKSDSEAAAALAVRAVDPAAAAVDAVRGEGTEYAVKSDVDTLTRDGAIVRTETGFEASPDTRFVAVRNPETGIFDVVTSSQEGYRTIGRMTPAQSAEIAAKFPNSEVAEVVMSRTEIAQDGSPTAYFQSTPSSMETVQVMNDAYQVVSSALSNFRTEVTPPRDPLQRMFLDGKEAYSVTGKNELGIEMAISEIYDAYRANDATRMARGVMEAYRSAGLPVPGRNDVMRMTLRGIKDYTRVLSDIHTDVRGAYGDAESTAIRSAMISARKRFTGNRFAVNSDRVAVSRMSEDRFRRVGKVLSRIDQMTRQEGPQIGETGRALLPTEAANRLIGLAKFLGMDMDLATARRILSLPAGNDRIEAFRNYSASFDLAVKARIENIKNGFARDIILVTRYGSADPVPPVKELAERIGIRLTPDEVAEILKVPPGEGRTDKFMETVGKRADEIADVETREAVRGLAEEHAEDVTLRDSEPEPGPVVAADEPSAVQEEVKSQVTVQKAEPKKLSRPDSEGRTWSEGVSESDKEAIIEAESSKSVSDKDKLMKRLSPEAMEEVERRAKERLTEAKKTMDGPCEI